MCFYCSVFIYSPCNLCPGRRKEQFGPGSRKQLMSKGRSSRYPLVLPYISALPQPCLSPQESSVLVLYTWLAPANFHILEQLWCSALSFTQNVPDIVSTGFPSSNKNICLNWKGWVFRLQKLWEISFQFVSDSLFYRPQKPSEEANPSHWRVRGWPWVLVVCDK